MLATDLKTDGIVDNTYTGAVLGHRCARILDPNYKVSREEIKQIIAEAQISTSSAINSQPYRFLVIDTDEGKEKLDTLMAPIDKDRVKQCSFAIIPFADRAWWDYYDGILEQDKVVAPGLWDENYLSVLLPVVEQWIGILQEYQIYLDKSVNFQAGQISQSFQFACRAHGLDTGVMDAWFPEPGLNELFGIDLDRYIPEVVIAVGKVAGPVHNNFRLDPDEIVDFA